MKFQKVNYLCKTTPFIHNTELEIGQKILLSLLCAPLLKDNGAGNVIKVFWTKSVFVTGDLWSDNKFLASLAVLGDAGLWGVGGL